MKTRAVEIAQRAAEELSLLVFEWSVTTGLVQTRPTRPELGIGTGKPTAALEHVLKNRYPKKCGLHLQGPRPTSSRSLFTAPVRDIAAFERPTVLLVDADALGRANAPAGHAAVAETAWNGTNCCEVVRGDVTHGEEPELSRDSRAD